MSVNFQDLYFTECQKSACLRDENANLRIRLQQCEDQRKSLLFLVRSVTLSLEENHFPRLAALLRSNIGHLEEVYAEQAIEALRQTASAAPGGSTHEAGSGAVSEAAAQLESTEALSVSDRSSFLPPAVQYTGNWDDCALTKHQAD